ncbi:MAG TPA: hypothetical protein VIT62_17070 [Lysobacter sp.]
MRKMSMVVSLLLVSGVAAAHTGMGAQGAVVKSDVGHSAVRMDQGVMVAAGKKTKTAEAAPAAEAPKAEATAEAAPGEYKPKTEFDNTPYRFNMHQNGKKMTAEEFDAWMKARGIRVAKGAPGAQPAAAAGGAQVASDAKGK